MGEDMKWITRVPQTLTLSKGLLSSDLKFTTGEDPRYSFYETCINYADVEQKWVVVHSTEMQKRKDTSFDKKVEKHLQQALKELKHLKNIDFVCEDDARSFVEK